METLGIAIVLLAGSYLYSVRNSLSSSPDKSPLQLSKSDKILLNKIEGDHLKRSAALLGNIDPNSRADIYELYPLSTSTKGK